MKILQKFTNWWRWHRAVIWLTFTTFPLVWLNHPELQALLPAKIVSLIAPAMGAIGFISEMVTQVGGKKNVVSNDSK